MNTGQIMSLVDEEVGNRPESILDFIQALGEAAYATGSHLSENWQDTASAKQWEKIGNLMWQMSEKVSKLFPF
jgi:hypothetical protein